MRPAAEPPRKYVIKSFSVPPSLITWIDTTVTRLRELGIPANRSWLCRVAIDSQLPPLLELPPDDMIREICRIQRASRL